MIVGGGGAARLLVSDKVTSSTLLSASDAIGVMLSFAEVNGNGLGPGETTADAFSALSSLYTVKKYLELVTPSSATTTMGTRTETPGWSPTMYATGRKLALDLQGIQLSCTAPPLPLQFLGMNDAYRTNAIF